VVYHQLPPKVLAVADEAVTFVMPPKLELQSDRPWQLERLIRKFDPVERDLRNRLLGRAGEEFVLEMERKKLEKSRRPDLLKKIRWVSADEGDGAGYDILSFEPDGRERLIEVKTTNGAARTPFFISENECQRAAASAESWRLYRVHLFAQNPRIFQIAPPLKDVLHLRPDTWRASFS
jgi:Protein NO VEIN, C-terminal